LIYEAALEMSKTAPLVGKGLGTFSLHLPAYRDKELARFFPRNEYHVEHGVSEPLEVLVESGILGLLGWILLVGAFVIRPLWAMGRIPDPGLRALMVASAAGVLGLAAHSAVEVNLRFQPPLFLFFALAGLALAAERAGAEAPAPGRTVTVTGWPGRLGIAVVTGMAFGLSLAMMLSDFVASYHVGAGRRALKANDLRAAEQDFRSAEQAWSGNLPGRYRRAGVLWKLGRLEEAEAEYREVLRRSPYYFDANHNLARVLHGRGKPEEAARFLEVATRINPYHVPSHALAVRLALRRGRLEEAERVALQIRERAGHDLRTRVILARVRAAQGRRGEARALLEEVLDKEPGNKVARHLLRRLRSRR
jgi:Tfp pilus assembly protein PilF